MLTSAASSQAKEGSALSEELKKKAEAELNECQDRVHEDIEALRNLVLGEPNLNACLDDAFLLRFLRARKFRLQKAFDLLRNYYKIAARNPHLFKDFTPSAMKEIFSGNFQGFLPLRDDQGRAVYILRAGLWNPSQFSIDQMFRCNVLSLERIIQDEAIQINGAVFLVDLSGLSFRHITAVTPRGIRNMLDILQDSFPCRFKGFHLVRESMLTYMLFSIVKPLLSSKIRSRVHFHGDNMKSLHDHVPKEILPKEFGGLQGPFDNTAWYRELVENDETFKVRTHYGYKSQGGDTGLR